MDNLEIFSMFCIWFLLSCLLCHAKQFLVWYNPPFLFVLFCFVLYYFYFLWFLVLFKTHLSISMSKLFFLCFILVVLLLYILSKVFKAFWVDLYKLWAVRFSFFFCILITNYPSIFYWKDFFLHCVFLALHGKSDKYKCNLVLLISQKHSFNVSV